MFYLRKAQDRGKVKQSWLESYHTFSFGEYRDPVHMGFGKMRVINEDFIQGHSGFGKHPHQNMEILTYIMEGELEHEDSLGNKERITAGEFQRMSAGTGIIHSEVNPLSQTCHLYQIWIHSKEMGINPSYEQKKFGDLALNKLHLVVSADAREHSMKIYQDVDIYFAEFNESNRIDLSLFQYEKAWIQVITGELTVADYKLKTSDALGVEDLKSLNISSSDSSKFMIFNFD